MSDREPEEPRETPAGSENGEWQSSPRNLETFVVAVVLLHLIAPIFDNRPLAGFLIPILFTLVLVAGLRAVSRSRKQLLIAALLAAPWFAHLWSMETLRYSLGRHGAVIGSVSGLVFFGYLTWNFLRHILSEEEVTRDTIFGAVAVFFLLGTSWTSAYVLLEFLEPGSFDFSDHFKAQVVAPVAGYQHYEHLSYFSFVTLTTLGYGDITPISDYARTLSTLEAIVGQLYIAILVARIVALHTIGYQHRKRS